MLCISGGKNTDFIRYFYYFCKLEHIKKTTIKRAIKIIWRTLVATASILFAGVLTIQFPQVQTYIASKVVDTLSDKLDGEIRFEKIHLRPFTTLVLKNAVIIDKNPYTEPSDSTCFPIDTFFRAEYIIARFSFDGLFRQDALHLDKAYIANAQMNLILEDKSMIEGADTTYKDNLSRLFRLQSSEEKKERNDKELFHIRKVEIDGMGFHMKNHGSRRIEHKGGINWDDLDIKDIKLDVRELQFKGGVMSGEADRLSFREKSGFDVKEMSGKARVGRGKTIVTDLHIKDLWSDLHLNLYQMSFNKVKDFSSFLTKVRIDGDIDHSRLDFRTICYFAPELDGNTLNATISGKLSGYVSDFNIDKVRITTEDGEFSTVVSGSMKGLPEIEKTTLNADADNLFFTFRGLGRFISQWIPDGELDLSGLAKGMLFSGRAKADGLMNTMHAKAEISSLIGSAEADVKFNDLVRSGNDIGIRGTLATENLNIGRVIGNNIIGAGTLKAGFAMDISKKDGIRADLDSLRIRRLELKGYEYADIAAKGHVDRYAINGTVISQDPNCNFMIQGGYAKSTNTRNSVYRLNANIGYADLNAMNLDKRGKSIIQLQTNADFTQTADHNIVGKIGLGNIVVENNEGRFNIGDIVLASHSTNKEYKVRLDSKFAECSYSGTGSIIDFVKDLGNVTLKREIPSIFKDPSYAWTGKSYNLDLLCHDMQGILSFVVPGLYIENGTSLNMSISKDSRMDAVLSSKRLAYKKNYLKDIRTFFNNADSSFNVKFSCGELKAATIRMTDNNLQIYADSNHIGIGYSYDNHSELENKGEFIIHGAVSRNMDKPDLDLEIKPSTLFINSKEWNIQPSNIFLNSDMIDVRKFGLISGEQSVNVAGRTSKTQQDTLTLALERFDISIINSILPSDFGFRGALTGDVQLVSPTEDKGILADLICDSTYVANVPLGILRMGTYWDEDRKCFDIYARNSLDGTSNIDAKGLLFPDTRRLMAEAELNRLNVSYAQPFLKDIFSEMAGDISGRISVNGPLDRLSIRSSDTRLDDVMLRIGYTNVPYYANGPFHMNENGVYFDEVSINDRFNGKGVLTGSINYQYFNNIGFDARFKVEQIEAVNLDEKSSDVFYGNLFATGNVAITGPLNSIKLTVDAVTAKTGQLHIPLSSSLTSGGSTDILKFKELEKEIFVDPYEIFVKKADTKEKSKSDFSVNLKVNASPEVEAFVEIDKASGNVLSGRGTGRIELDIADDLFNINGDYTLNSGNYKFSAMGLVTRDFLIQDGSSIRFNGDIMDSSLDIDAIYKTKASIATLISDTTSVANRRTVECSIGITDKLSNPSLKFGIEIPDLDPTVKSRVESALSTDDKIQKQFLSLIISNNFLPDEQSGIVNNSSLLYSNVSEVMANQLNNIFQKLDIPVDLGLNYQPNERGNDIFDVAVSTQLFNNRVVVNGSVGNKQYSSGNTQNDVVGDLDIEIKLNRSGSFRLNIFSHSADQYTNYLDNSQRNGVGLMFQTEFNNLGLFFRNIFSKKEKRQEAKRLEEQAMIEGGKNIIIIESEK